LTPCSRTRTPEASRSFGTCSAVFDVGSYYVAEEIKVKRPRRRGEQPAARSEAPPAEHARHAPAPAQLTA